MTITREIPDQHNKLRFVGLTLLLQTCKVDRCLRVRGDSGVRGLSPRFYHFIRLGLLSSQAQIRWLVQALADGCGNCQGSFVLCNEYRRHQIIEVLHFSGSSSFDRLERYCDLRVAIVCLQIGHGAELCSSKTSLAVFFAVARCPKSLRPMG